MAVVLDSSVLIAAERRQFDFERFLEVHSPAMIAAITAAELLIGVERADTPERRARRSGFVESVLVNSLVIEFDLPRARTYAVKVAEMARRGETIGDRDLQIAVSALSLDCELATLNVREFRRVTGLRILDVSEFLTP